MFTRFSMRISGLPILLVFSFFLLSIGCSSDSTMVDEDNFDVEMANTDSDDDGDEVEDSADDVNNTDVDADGNEVDVVDSETDNENTETVFETVIAQELPVYDSEPVTALEFAAWLRTAVDGEANNGGWSCYANTLTSEVGWSGLYFGGAADSVVGTASEALDDRHWLVGDPVGYTVTSNTSVEFGDQFIWSDARFVVSENTYPIFSADDSRGFRVTCTRTNDVPEYS